MVRKSQKSEEPKQPLLLKMTREEAADKLARRLIEGRQLLQTPVDTQGDYEEVKARFAKWNNYNLFLLKNLFTSEEIAEEYNRIQPAFMISSIWYDNYQNHINGQKKKLTKIESVIEMLELVTVSTEIQQPGEESQSDELLQVKVKPQAVFIGHGRSKLWGRVKSLLHDDYDIDSFTFESESHVGEPIVPILERFLEKASFAILILTAEDETPDGKSRARQNVVHEAGLFQGRLGFRKAILLRQEGLDDFSNVDGLQYIGFTGDNIEQTFYELGRVLKREGVRSNGKT